MLKKFRLITFTIQLGLIIIPFLLLAGCASVDQKHSLVLLPTHIENMDTLVIDEEKKQLLHDSFSVAIGDQEYQIVSKERVDKQLQPNHKQGCHSIKCQKEVAAIFHSPFVAYGQISKYENSYELTITVTDTRSSVQKIKQRNNRHNRGSFCDLVQGVRKMEYSSWQRGIRPAKRVKMTEKMVLERTTERANSPRSSEQTALVVDRYKSRLLAIYQRALRRNPSLRGRIIFEIVIEATGKVSAAKVISSDVNDEVLEKKLATRIMMFKFGAREIEKMTLTIPIDFYPS